jgi:hypothetical protein
MEQLFVDPISRQTRRPGVEPTFLKAPPGVCISLFVLTLMQDLSTAFNFGIFYGAAVNTFPVATLLPKAHVRERHLNVCRVSGIS